MKNIKLILLFTVLSSLIQAQASERVFTVNPQRHTVRYDMSLGNTPILYLSISASKNNGVSVPYSEKRIQVKTMSLGSEIYGYVKSYIMERYGAQPDANFKIPVYSKWGKPFTSLDQFKSELKALNKKVAKKPTIAEQDLLKCQTELQVYKEMFEKFNPTNLKGQRNMSKEVAPSQQNNQLLNDSTGREQ